MIRYVIQLFGISDDHDLESIFPNRMHIWIARNVKREHMGYGYFEFHTPLELQAAVKYVNENMRGVRVMMLPAH